MQEYATGLGLPFRFDSSLNPRVDCGANRNRELQLDAREAVEARPRRPRAHARVQGVLRRVRAARTGSATPSTSTPAAPATRRSRWTPTASCCSASCRAATASTSARGQLRPRLGGHISRSCANGSGSRTGSADRATCCPCAATAPGAAEMETGDPEGIIPAFCELTHLRAWAAMGESSGHREDASCCLPKAVAAARSAASARLRRRLRSPRRGGAADPDRAPPRPGPVLLTRVRVVRASRGRIDAGRFLSHRHPFPRAPGVASTVPGPRGEATSSSSTRRSCPPTPRGQPLFESGGVWTLHRQDRGLLYTFRTPVLDPPLYKAVEIDRALRRGRLYFPPPRRGRRPRWALAYPLDELLFQHRFARSRAAPRSTRSGSSIGDGCCCSAATRARASPPWRGSGGARAPAT